MQIDSQSRNSVDYVSPFKEELSIRVSSILGATTDGEHLYQESLKNVIMQVTLTTWVAQLSVPHLKKDILPPSLFSL